MLEKMTPEQIKKCSQSELNVLCDEIRTVIYDTVMKCGGHLSSNLGSVESTVAMFYVFDFPKDKIKCFYLCFLLLKQSCLNGFDQHTI